jgi:hypothetical protein
MRIGVTQRLVYVAPKTRRTVGSPRANFGGLLLNRSLQPALDQQADQVTEGVGRLLDRVNSRF